MQQRSHGPLPARLQTLATFSVSCATASSSERGSLEAAVFPWHVEEVDVIPAWHLSLSKSPCCARVAADPHRSCHTPLVASPQGLSLLLASGKRPH